MPLVTREIVTFTDAQGRKASVHYVFDDLLLTVTSVLLVNETGQDLTVKFRNAVDSRDDLSLQATALLGAKAEVVLPGKYPMELVEYDYEGQKFSDFDCPALAGVSAVLADPGKAVAAAGRSGVVGDAG